MTGVVSTNPPNYGAASTNQGYSLTPQGGLRIQAMAGGADVSPTNPLPVAVQASGGSVTLITLDVKTVTTGGTPVTALIAGHRTGGGWIQNPPTATVNLGINEIGTAAGTTSSGDTTFIIPGQTYQLSPSANAVSVISSDSAHAFSGYGFQ